MVAIYRRKPNMPALTKTLLASVREQIRQFQELRRTRPAFVADRQPQRPIGAYLSTDTANLLTRARALRIIAPSARCVSRRDQRGFQA